MDYLLILIIVVAPVLSLVIGHWLADQAQADHDDYIKRFIQPKADRLRQLGVKEEDVNQLVEIAFKSANPEQVGRAPGAILYDMIDQIAVGRAVEDVIADWLEGAN